MEEEGLKLIVLIVAILRHMMRQSITLRVLTLESSEDANYKSQLWTLIN